jgi:hypothetical protein
MRNHEGEREKNSSRISGNARRAETGMDRKVEEQFSTGKSQLLLQIILPCFDPHLSQLRVHLQRCDSFFSYFSFPLVYSYCATLNLDRKNLIPNEPQYSYGKNRHWANIKVTSFFFFTFLLILLVLLP